MVHDSDCTFALPEADGKFYTDIVIELLITSVDSQRYAHFIRNGRGCVNPYLMEHKNESIYALDNFIKKVGVLEVLLCDNNATMFF